APKGRRSLMDVEARLQAMGRAALAGYARQALGSETAELADWHARRLAYSEVNPVSGGLYRLAGTARDGGTSVPWSLVLKVVRAPAGGARLVTATSGACGEGDSRCPRLLAGSGQER